MAKYSRYAEQMGYSPEEWERLTQNCINVFCEHPICLLPEIKLTIPKIKPDTISFKNELVFQNYIKSHLKDLDTTFSSGYSIFEDTTLTNDYFSKRYRFKWADILATTDYNKKIIIEVKLHAQRNALSQLLSYISDFEKRAGRLAIGIIVCLSFDKELSDIVNYYNNKISNNDIKIRLYKFDKTNLEFKQII